MDFTTGEKLRARGEAWTVDAIVVSAAFNRAGNRLAFGLGDGTAAWIDATATPGDQPGERPWKLLPLHGDGASLTLVADFDRDGFLSGGDDGRVVRIDKDGGTEEIAVWQGRWIEHIVAHPDSRFRAVGVGKNVEVLRHKDRLTLSHKSTVAGLDFDPKGKRLVVAHYGGVSLWWASSGPDQKPKTFEWAGSHIAVSFSPDGTYVVTGTQDNELHGWRLVDGASMRMSGYATKVKSMAWTPKPRFLATSGASTVTAWPFAGDGPMGKAPTEFGWSDTALVTRVASHPKQFYVAAGYEDGSIVVGDLPTRRSARIREPGDGRVTALTWSPDGTRLAIGHEGGKISLMGFTG